MESPALTWQLLVAASVVILYSLWKNYMATGKLAGKYFSKNVNPPEPPGAFPVLGHLPLLEGRGKTPAPLHRVLGAMADQLGPLFKLRLGTKQALVVSSWEAAKECFTTNDQALASRPSYAAGKYLGFDRAAIGFAPYGPYWREARRIAIRELLCIRRLEQLKRVREHEVGAWMKDLHYAASAGGGMVEMKQQFANLVCNVITMLVAGKRFFGRNSTVGVQKGNGGLEEEGKRFQRLVAELFHLSGTFILSDVMPSLEWLDLGGKIGAMKRTGEELDALMTSWLEEHRRERARGGGKRERRSMDGDGDGIGDGKEDLMHAVLSRFEENGEKEMFGFDVDTVAKAVPMSIVVAGTDTTSVTLTWALSLLLNHPHVLRRAQQELDAHVGSERHVDESDIDNLALLQAIVRETLRLYPAGPLAIPHQSIEGCSIGGCHVAAGTWVIPNIWKIQRDPRRWPDAESFLPERWFAGSQAEVDYRGQHFEYLPFGSGRRSCPGVALATQVLHLVLARLLHGFDLVRPSGEPVDMTEGVGLSVPKQTPLHLLLSPRLPPNLYA